MKWYWWTLIGVAVITIIAVVIYKNKNKKTETAPVPDAAEIPCTYNINFRTAGPDPLIPATGQGVMVNGVCVPK